MSALKKIYRFITKKEIRFAYLVKMGFYNHLNDEEFLKKEFYYRMGYTLDLNNPHTFDEKLQWLKIYNRNPIMTQLVDKCTVKDYVAETIGDEYIIPTLGIWDDFEEIDFKNLPDQFVIKCSHDCGSIIICRDKNLFDYNLAKKKIEKALSTNYYIMGREWPYKNVQPRILVEKYMEDREDQELRDYKFYCFNGYVKALLVATNRMGEGELYFDYFDENYEHINLTNHWHPNAINIPHRPRKFDEMKELASMLSKGWPHIRVDFYEVDGKIYFGEMTFYDMGGFLKIHPDEWNQEWGDLIDLSLVKI